MDDEPIEIRVLSAAVKYDGSIEAELLVTGHDDPIVQTFEGTADTLMLCWSEQEPRLIDLDGKTAADRRCLEILWRGVARLTDELERRRRMTHAPRRSDE